MNPETNVHAPEGASEREAITCSTYAEYQETAERLDAEGFIFDRNHETGDTRGLIDFYLGMGGISEIKLTSAFTRPSAENGYTGKPMPDFFGIWCKRK